MRKSTEEKLKMQLGTATRDSFLGVFYLSDGFIPGI